jgi:hypothetical protein
MCEWVQVTRLESCLPDVENCSYRFEGAGIRHSTLVYPSNRRAHPLTLLCIMTIHLALQHAEELLHIRLVPESDLDPVSCRSSFQTSRNMPAHRTCSSLCRP